MDTLKGYLDDEDVESFNEYVRETYRENQRDANDAIIDARQSFNDWGIKGPDRRDLQDSFHEHKDAFHECIAEAHRNFGSAKGNGYAAILSRHEDYLDDLADKDVDTSELEALIDEARTEVIEPLEDALDGAEAGQELRDAIGSYCLGNGCPNGENFHFWAKYALAKGKGFFDVLMPLAQDAGLDDEIVAVEDFIEAAEDAIDDVGTDFYTESTRGAVWDNLNSMKDALKDLLEAIKEA